MKGIDDQLNSLKEQQETLNKQWNQEKDQMRNLQGIKEEIDRVNLEIQSAERDYDLNRAAELKYGTLLDLQKKLSQTEKALEQKVRPLCINPFICCICQSDTTLVVFIKPPQNLILLETRDRHLSHATWRH